MRVHLTRGGVFQTTLASLCLMGGLAAAQLVIGPMGMPSDHFVIGSQLQWSQQGQIFSFVTGTTISHFSSVGYSEHAEQWNQMSANLIDAGFNGVQAQPQNGYLDQLGAVVAYKDQSLLPNRGYVPQRASSRQLYTYTKDVTSTAHQQARDAGIEEMKSLNTSAGQKMFDVKLAGTQIGYVKEVPVSGNEAILHWTFTDGTCVRFNPEDPEGKKLGDAQRPYACLRPDLGEYEFITRTSPLSSTSGLANYTYVKSQVSNLYLRMMSGTDALTWDGTTFKYDPAGSQVANDAWRAIIPNKTGTPPESYALYWKDDAQKVITVNSSGAVTVQNYAAGTNTQLWRFDQQSGGGYYIRSIADPGKALTRQGSGLILKKVSEGATVWPVQMR